MIRSFFIDLLHLTLAFAIGVLIVAGYGWLDAAVRAWIGGR